MTLLLPRRCIPLSCRAPGLSRLVLSYRWSTSGRKISQQKRHGGRNTCTEQREGGYLHNDRFNALSHKHALIRAEGWCTCCGIQIKTERGAGGAVSHTLCSGQVVSSLVTTERTAQPTDSVIM